MEELALRLIKICISLEISCRTLRRYTIAKELLEFGTLREKEEIFYHIHFQKRIGLMFWIKPKALLNILRKLYKDGNTIYHMEIFNTT